jgi:hypothetical protein
VLDDLDARHRAARARILRLDICELALFGIRTRGARPGKAGWSLGVESQRFEITRAQAYRLIRMWTGRAPDPAGGTLLIVGRSRIQGAYRGDLRSLALIGRLEKPVLPPRGLAPLLAAQGVGLDERPKA